MQFYVTAFRNSFLMNICFSIIVITKSNIDDLLTTLESINKIDHNEFEVIVVNGSQEEYTTPPDYGKHFSLTEIYDEGSGIYHAMNVGIQHIQGDYAVFMNAGDQFASSLILSDVKQVLQADSDTDILCGAAIRSDKKNNRSNTFWPRNPDVLVFGMIACHQSIYYRCSLLRKHKFDESGHVSNDWRNLLDMYRLGYKFNITDQVYSIFDTSGLSSRRPIRTLFDHWLYAIKTEGNRLHISAVYLRKILRAARGRLSFK